MLPITQYCFLLVKGHRILGEELGNGHSFVRFSGHARHKLCRSQHKNLSEPPLYVDLKISFGIVGLWCQKKKDIPCSTVPITIKAPSDTVTKLCITQSGLTQSD